MDGNGHCRNVQSMNIFVEFVFHPSLIQNSSNLSELSISQLVTEVEVEYWFGFPMAAWEMGFGRSDNLV